MRLATFIVDRRERLGVVDAEGRLLIDLAVAEKAVARREKRPAQSCFSDMLTLLEAGTRGMAAARRTARATWKRLGSRVAADGRLVFDVRRVKLAAPVPRPRKVFCLAGNYRDHIEWADRADPQVAGPLTASRFEHFNSLLTHGE